MDSAFSMTMRRCLRRVSASFLVSSTFWVDFFTSPCGFLENILPPPRPTPAPSRSGQSGGKWREWAGRRLLRAAHSLPSLAGPSAADSSQTKARAATSTRLARRLQGTFASSSNMAAPPSSSARRDGDPGGLPAAAAVTCGRRSPPQARAGHPGPVAAQMRLSAAAAALVSP